MEAQGGTSRLARLIQTLDRYGSAIEYDLQKELGVDILDFFRGKYSWRKLETFIDHLPTGSAYWAARADDDEAAEYYLRQRPTPHKGDARPSLRDMSLTNQLLMEAIDGLSAISARIDVTNGHKSAKVNPIPRPLTAMERAEVRLESRETNDLVAEVEAAMERWEDVG